jgi:hypothetical protein
MFKIFVLCIHRRLLLVSRFTKILVFLFPAPPLFYSAPSFALVLGPPQTPPATAHKHAERRRNIKTNAKIAPNSGKLEQFLLQ